MPEAFVQQYAMLIAAHPQDVRVERIVHSPTFHELKITVHPQDIGRIIGKEGRTIHALKTLISGCKAKDGVGYRINVASKDNG